MPARKSAKGKVVKTKKTAAKPKGGTAKKARKELTSGEAYTLLRRSRENWTSLGEDIRAIEELLKGHPAKEQLSDELNRLLQLLWKKIPIIAKLDCPPHRV